MPVDSVQTNPNPQALRWANELGLQGKCGSKEVAGEFESLLMASMLRTMREASGEKGWLGTGEDQSSQALIDFAEQSVAAVMARSGGFGLAKVLEEAFAQESAVENQTADGASNSD